MSLCAWSYPQGENLSSSPPNLNLPPLPLQGGDREGAGSRHRHLLLRRSPRPTLTPSPQRRGPPWTWRPGPRPPPLLPAPGARALLAFLRSLTGLLRLGQENPELQERAQARAPGQPAGPALGQHRGPNPGLRRRPPRQPPLRASVGLTPPPRPSAAANHKPGPCSTSAPVLT